MRRISRAVLGINPACSFPGFSPLSSSQALALQNHGEHCSISTSESNAQSESSATHRFQVYVHSVMRVFPCGFYSAGLNCRHIGRQTHSTRPAPRVGHRKEVCRRCLHPLVGRRLADPSCAAAFSNMVRHPAVTIPATSRLAAGARLLRFMRSSTHDSSYVHKYRDMMRLPTASLNENILFQTRNLHLSWTCQP